MKRGFSLTELLTTIVIMAVLASIAIPGFSRSRDKAAASQAVAYLRVIATAEKMYFAKFSAYECPTTDPCAGRTEIQSDLGAEVTEENYTFSVTASSATAFTATATRTGCTMTLNQAGTFTAAAGCPYTAATLNT